MTEKQLAAKGYKITYTFLWQKSVLLEKDGESYSANYKGNPRKYFDLRKSSGPDKILVE